MQAVKSEREQKEARIEKLNEQIKAIGSDFEAVLLSDGNNISIRCKKKQVSQYGWGVTDDFILQRVNDWKDNPEAIQHALKLKPSTSRTDPD